MDLSANPWHSLPDLSPAHSSLQYLYLSNASIVGHLNLFNFTKLAGADLHLNDLINVTLPSTPDMDFVSVAFNQRLLNVFGTTAIATADISNTSFVRDSRVCDTIGSKILRAADIDANVFQQVPLSTFLEKCLRKVEYLDISGSTSSLKLSDLAFLSNLTYYFNDMDGAGRPYQCTQSRCTHLVPAADFVMGSNSSIQCNRQTSFDTASLALRGYLQTISVLTARYRCQCAANYYQDQHLCQPIVIIKTKRTAQIVLIATFSVLSGALLIYMLSTYLRRRFRHMRNDLELHQLLLEDAKAEVMDLRRVWEIDSANVRLERRIDGSSPGAFGAVWAADWDGLKVAVKVLHAEMLDLDPNSVEEFSKEAEFFMKARHPNVVRFFGAGTMPNGAPFLMLELVSQGSLRSLLRGGRSEGKLIGGAAGTPLSLKLKLQLTADIAKGMAFIHSMGALHRDLKSGKMRETKRGSCTRAFCLSKHLPLSCHCRQCARD